MSSDGNTAITTPVINNSAKLSTLIPGTSASSGIFIALFVAAFMYVFYKYTIKGYELKQVGENLQFAKVGGVNVVRTFLSIFLIFGFVSGLCGGIEIIGSYNRFTARYTIKAVWDGIMIAHIANRNFIAIIFVSLIWGALTAGSLHMERVTSLNKVRMKFMRTRKLTAMEEGKWL